MNTSRRCGQDTRPSTDDDSIPYIRKGDRLQRLPFSFPMNRSCLGCEKYYFGGEKVVNRWSSGRSIQTEIMLRYNRHRGHGKNDTSRKILASCHDRLSDRTKVAAARGNFFSGPVKPSAIYSTRVSGLG